MYEKLVTKKNTLIVAIVATALFIMFSSPALSGLCPAFGPRFWPRCEDYYSTISVAILWAPALLILSLAMYLFEIEKKVFDSWVKFSILWLAFSSAATYITPLQINFDSLDWKGVVSLFLTALFFIISILIIVTKSIQLKRSK